MSCYHPCLVRVTYSKTTGEANYKFLGSASSEELKDKFSGEFDPNKFHWNNTFNDTLTGSDFTTGQFIQIPCGKCIGCRIDYSRSWADRLTYHSFGKEGKCWFLTLTYDDYHMQSELDYSPNYDLYALNYDHLNDFVKGLRNYYYYRGVKDIDFFSCGEYGDSSFRSHFHMIIYGCEFTDLKFHKLNDNGDPIYTSEFLENLWGKGYVTVSEFSWTAAAYCASYVVKKLDGRRLDEYTAVGLTPEKMRCSRRPGIANEFYNENAERIWELGGYNVDRSIHSSGKLGIPRYFRKLVEKNHNDLMRSDSSASDPAFEAFLRWKNSNVEHINLTNPFKLSNSSFDIDRIKNMLDFEERELLRKKSSRSY